MALSIGSAGALPAVKQSSFFPKSLSKNCINVSKIRGLRFKIQVILSLVFCILCFTAFAASAQPEEQRIWTPVPLTSDAQIQSYVALCRAVYWENMGDYRETRRQLEAAIRLNPRSSFLYAKLAETLYALRFFRDAEAACKTSLKLNSNNADAQNEIFSREFFLFIRSSNICFILFKDTFIYRTSSFNNASEYI